MNPLDILRQKPWLPGTELATASGNIADAGRTALRFFMAVVTVLFFLFTITFLARSQYPDFEALAGQPWQPFSDASTLWVNTGLLVLGSVAMQAAVYCSRRGGDRGAVLWATGGAVFAVAFLVAQLNLWQHLRMMGFFANTNPANSYFYLLTAVHGLHLMGGLIALCNVAARCWYEQDQQRFFGALALCASYWHFLLLIWAGLFALLTSEAETINSLAALCGF
ncbi:MAG: cytochrome c oxidase subunit 3 [Halieaceae bacterium]|jgi:cytochrome c oxidase subunit 3